MLFTTTKIIKYCYFILIILIFIQDYQSDTHLNQQEIFFFLNLQISFLLILLRKTPYKYKRKTIN